MFEYIDASGQIYTEDQINKMAAEQKTSANAIIKDKGLKRKSSGVSASAKPAKKTYPWSDQTKEKKSEGDFLGTFKKAQKNKKANIKKSTEEVSAFVGKQNDYSFYQKDPIQDILNPTSEFEKAIANIPIGKPKQEFEILEEKEAEVMNYIKSKPIDYASIDKLYADEVNDSQTIDYIREGAKGFLNDVILSPVSMVGQTLGADIDMTISPYKPLETQKKKAIDILSKTAKKGQKINAADVDALAKEIFYKEQVLIQEGKAAEEYWDDQPLYIGEVAAQKEKLKIRAVQDVLVSSDLARQQTILAKTYNSQLSSFEKYANLFKDKYTKGEVTEEEIATYETRREDARKAMDNLKGIADNYPAYVDKIKTDEEKLEYFKYNYDDVTANLSKFIGTGINILGGATKLIGSTIEYAEGDEKGLGGFLGEVGTANIEMGNKIKEDAKNISFDNVNSFGDFGKYFAGLVSEQLPIYAAMYFGGNYGLAAVSMGAGGQKIQEMEDEIGSDYDLGTKLLAGYGFALSEFIPEKLGTLRMFENMKKTMSAVSKQQRQLFKDSFIKSSLKTAGTIGFESQIEGATEVVTEGLNMLLDEHLLGQPVSPTDRVKRFKEAYAGGAFMGGGAQFAGGVSTLVAKELKNYATDKELAASKAIMERIDFLQNELQTNPRLSGKESEEIITEIKKLSNEAVKVIENSEDRVYDMSKEDMVDVLLINKQQQDLRDAYVELSQSNFSPEIKKEKVAELKKQFGELENKREYLLTGKYAEINKMIGNRTIINSGADNIRKIVASLGEENIENRIGDQGSIAVFEDTDSLKKAYKEWLTAENNTIKKKIADGELPANTKIKSEDEITNEVNEAAKTDGFALPNGQSVINLSVASRTGAINVAQHEFLHKVLAKALSNPVERKKIVNGFLATLTNKERAVVQKRIDENYLNPETGKIDDENLEEYFTAFIDAIAYGEIGNRNQVKDVLRRAARPVLKVLQKLGFSNAKFSEGRDFYDFLKEYQSNASKGRISNRAKALLDGASVARPIRYSKSIEERMDDLDEQLNDGEIDYDTYEKKMVALEKEEAEMKRKEYEEKKAETGKEPEVKKADKKATKQKEPKSKEEIEISEVAAKAKAKLDAIGNDPRGYNPNNPTIYDELAKMVKVKSRNWRTNKGTVIDFTNKDKGGLDGFSLEEMVSYVRTSMIPYIAKFDPSKNNSLYGYINAQYINRMRGALKSGEVADVVFTEDVTEMTKLSAEDVEPTKPSLPERKRFQNILESGVFSPDVIENIQAKILPVVRTLRANINEKTSLNRTVAPIISEIRDEMGKQADIDIKKAMGGKENQELQNWLITNKKTILENMTTTWLMGKDMGDKVAGGMPFAIQKRVDGRWLNYPAWVGKKIDRESVDVDLAGRTAGHEMARRLPEVNRNVETMEYLSSIIDLETGNPIRGRKESLAKALAEEVSFDIISDDLSSNGPIAQALNRNQQLKGAVVEDIIVEEFNRLAERGNVKFSISNTNIDLNAAARFMIDSKGNMDVINAAINNKSKNYNINEFQKLYKYITKYGVTDEDLKYLMGKYDDVFNEVAGPLMNDKEVKFSKSLENNLNSYNKSDKGITLVSDYIAENNIKRIDAETAFDVLNDLNKSIEDWWSVVENKTIEGMMSSVDYAFDVIEDRENEGGPMITAVNNALNLETIKFAEKQLNDWISNDTKWKARPKFSVSAWHGSPHSFDKFTTEKIGTGEGAQAFGWGLYFTDLEGIATNYAKTLSKGGMSVIDKDILKLTELYLLDFTEAINNRVPFFNGRVSKDKLIEIAGREIKQLKQSLIKPDAVVSEDLIDGIIKEHEGIEIKEIKDAVEKLKKTKSEGKNVISALNNIVKEVDVALNKYYSKDPSNFVVELKGNLYKVSLHKGKTPSEYTWLEWDKIPNKNLVNKLLSKLNQDQIDKGFYYGLSPGETNSSFYYKLSDVLGSDKAASLFLLENGIDGIKFPAESISRGATSDTARGFNYVVFDENAISVESKIKFSKSLSALSQFNDISKSEKEFIDISEKFVKDVMNKSGLNRKAIQLETLTVKEDNELYNFDQEYQELYDKDYDGTITEAERARMEEIYKSNVLAKKVNKILEIYNKAKINSNNNDIVNAVESSMPKKTLAPVKFSKSLDYEFNDMLERNKGVPSYESISDIVAKRKGAKVNRFSFYIPPSADDFLGLTSYMFAGKGKQGDLDQQFFDRNLIIPYVKGINTLDTVRQSIKKSYKELLSSFPEIKSKLEKLIPDKSFTYDQAVRVYLWAKNDIDIPGLNRRDKNKLVFIVKNDPDLIAFAEALSIAGRQDGGWWKPSTTWDSETIISDLHNITEGDGRKMWLEEFIENANAIFSKENLNKVQSIYGTSVRVALEDALYRMKNGKNRPEGTDALTNRWMNWINGSTAAIMFLNLRSAILQTISTTNYLNWSDNNPLMAAKAFANQKQYWTDFAMILNSDKLKERRSGLKADVTQSEIANAANNTKDKARGVLSYLQKKGFTPTQAADSFAIALGGSTFYRNRVNTYLNKADEDGNLMHTEKEAEDLAWLDFSRATDQSMQSADPLYVSKQQTTSLGRLVLAFANTPMQYSRLMKKAALDLVNKRGDWRTNISKIVYYGFLQNMIFSYLQAAMFLPFDDEAEDIANMTEEQKKEYEKLKKKQDDKAINILNGMADTLLRGSGITGALISTIKNVYMEYDKQEKREMFADHAYTIIAAAGISPPISSKVRKLYGAHRTKKFDKDVIAERGWEITKDGRLNLSPNYQIVGNIAVATTNIPLDRVVEKVNNVSEALDSRNTKLQRTALMLGWKAWELNVKNEESEAIKAKAKEVRKKEGVEKAIETRERKADSIKQMIKEMPSAERSAYLRKQKLEKREKTIEKRKRAIAKKKKRRMGGD